jgi:HD-like signal output (HDOD) protein
MLGETTDNRSTPNEGSHSESGAEMEKARAIGFEFVKALGRKLSNGNLELPPFPDVAVRVQNAISHPNVDAKKVARVVLSEPILTTRILRLANSAYLHRGGMEVTHLRTAISRVGLDMVRNAAVALAMDETFVVRTGSFMQERLKQLRKHSLEVAALSYVLTKRFCKHYKPDEAMLAGLLHEIGKFYILTQVEAFPELFVNDRLLDELTEQWYPGIGCAIVESWGFGKAVVIAVDEHNDLSREHPGPLDLADMVQVANILSEMMDSTSAGKLDLDGIAACRRMNLNAEISVSIIQKSAQLVRSLSQALSE